VSPSGSGFGPGSDADTGGGSGSAVGASGERSRGDGSGPDPGGATEPAFRDRALVLGDTLIVADLHVGMAARSGVEFPVGERADLVERFEALLSAVRPAEAVVAGDLLHAFSSVPRGVGGTLRDLRRTAREAGVRPVVVRGNHDTMLESVWEGPVDEAYRVDGTDTVVCHGHDPPDAPAARYVVGHDHPVIEIEGQRRPCHLRGGYGGAEVIVLPAFTRLAPGAVVNGMRAADFQSPLVTDVDALRPVVRDAEAGETLEFPPLGEFRRML